jgi:hypothetical protein
MQALKEMFGSKKAITGAVTAIVDIIILFLPEDKVTPDMKKLAIGVLSGLAMTYMLSQGIADNGKEAKKLELKASAAPTPTPEVPDAGDVPS